MTEGDFFGNEKSVTIENDGYLRIEFISEDGSRKILKENLPISAGEIVDAAVMSVATLKAFFEKEIENAKAQGVLFSLHLKATMMKVSDPIIFGHAVKVYYRDLFLKYGDLFDDLGVEPNNGIGDVHKKIAGLPEEKRLEIEADLRAIYKKRPGLAMVNSEKGITNLHVPSDVIIDASMPAAIRSSGQMWNAEGDLQDMKAVIPDRSYSRVYQASIDFCKEHGAFDPASMGTVHNVGLMAQKAEEYGSHDKTFEIKSHGKVRVVDADGQRVFEHPVEKGDIWRMCQVKDAAIGDWVKLGIARARITNHPAVFWLDEKRPHDAQLLAKVNKLLKTHETEGLDIRIMAPEDATRFCLGRMKEGQDSISVTGNVLRDYLTDLFPILELGTSAKMLSIVKLMAGGGLFETGAGGSAPKHVQQFEQENHLRWDSLGEFLALAASLEHLSESCGLEKAKTLAEALDRATAAYMQNNRSPSRNVGDIDTRGSHFYLTMYWARELTEQTDDADLKANFEIFSTYLSENESQIMEDLKKVQGKAIDIGGYYQPEDVKVSAAMRPSTIFNKALDLIA
jgi:isocitrate dehydrogenase